LYRLELDRTICVSRGTCIDICPEVFEFADDGLSSIKGVELANLQELDMDDPLCTINAMENCPSGAINVHGG